MAVRESLNNVLLWLLEKNRFYIAQILFLPSILSLAAAVCTWYGVVCVHDSPPLGLLQGLNLSSNSLSNALHHEIGLLGSDLRTLDLSNNAIGGPLPETISKLANLDGLFLGSNLFISTMPSSITQLYSLTSLYINDCLLRGSIPTELPDLTNLVALGLHVGCRNLPLTESAGFPVVQLIHHSWLQNTFAGEPTLRNNSLQLTSVDGIGGVVFRRKFALRYNPSASRSLD
jgi:hypothetical protein